MKTKVIEVSEEPFAKAKEVKKEVAEEVKQKPKVDPWVYGWVKKQKFTSAAGTWLKWDPRLPKEVEEVKHKESWSIQKEEIF